MIFKIMNIDITDFTIYLSVKLGLSDGTVKGYTEKLTYFLKWLKKNNLSISTKSIEMYLFGKKDMANTINIYIYLFRHLEAYLKDRGTPIDLVVGFKPRKVERPPITILTPDEVKTLLNTHVSYGKQNSVFKEVSEKYRIFTMFLYLTCCRVSEAINIKVGEVDLGGGWVTFTHTKGKKYRRVPIQEPLISALKPYIKDKTPDQLLFLNKNGTPIHKGNYWRDLQKRARQAGIATHIHAHTFRHSGASHLLEQNVQIELVGQILGHTDIGLTMNTYIHLKQEQLQRAIVRMPYYQEKTDPRGILKQIKEMIEGYKLQDDSRFDYQLLEDNNALQFKLVATT